MKITERKEVVHRQVEEVLVGRTCDVCGRAIEKQPGSGRYNYFVLHTHHSDWGNDSVDSHEYRDACCAECALKFAKDYIRDSYRRGNNTEEIEIRHTNWLETDAPDTY